MISLVCGLPQDEPIALLVDVLRARQADFRLLNPEKLGEHISVNWQLATDGLHGEISLDGERIDIQAIRSVYQRWVNVEDVIGNAEPAEKIEQARSVMRALIDLFDILPVRMVNRRRPMMSNNSKPYQSLLIRQAGFDIPETLITNQPQSLGEFVQKHQQVIYKSIGSTRSIVARLDESAPQKVKHLQNLPTQFQRKLQGFNLRVHVIGRRVFATKILSQDTDYRYASQHGNDADFKAFELNNELRKKCIALARLCGFNFAGVDLMVEAQKVTCLEVNPSPAYSYYQKITGQPIAEALADYLAG